MKVDRSSTGGSGVQAAHPYFAAKDRHAYMGREPRATSSNAGRKSTTLDSEYRDSSNTSRKRKSAYLD